MFEIDGHRLFGFDKSILELFIRGSTMYWFLFAIFRFIMRREVGGVCIADASQNAMTNEYDAVTEGLVVVGTLIFWNVVTNRAVRSRWPTGAGSSAFRRSGYALPCGRSGRR